MEVELTEWFDRKKCGKTVKVMPFERDDGFWFLIRRGEPIRRQGAVLDGKSGSVVYRPEKHGRTDIRLDACFRLQPGTCSIDNGTPVGRTITRVFTGYLAREFGEGAFTIVRVAAGNTESEAA